MQFRAASTRVSRGGVTLQYLGQQSEAWRTLERIERAIAAMRAVFDGMQQRESVDDLAVWIIPDRDAYIGGVRAIGGADGGNSGGMCCIRDDNAYVFVHGWSWPTLQHELWHALSHIYLGDCAPWIDEGLAEVFERGVDVDGNFVIGAISERDRGRVRDALRGGGLKPTIEFASVGDTTWSTRLRHGTSDGSVQYTQAWITMQFLLFADEGAHRGYLNRLLRELNRGQSSRSALNASIGGTAASLKAFDAAILRYIERLEVVDPKAMEELLRKWGEDVAARVPADRCEPEQLTAETAGLAKRAKDAGLSCEFEGKVRCITTGSAPLHEHVVEIAPVHGMRWEVRWERPASAPSARTTPTPAEDGDGTPPVPESAAPSRPGENGSESDEERKPKQAASTDPSTDRPPHRVRIRWFLSR
jgi:hypothetical protein